MKSIYRNNKNVDCKVSFSLKDNNLSVDINWPEDTPLETIGTLASIIATGEAFPMVFSKLLELVEERNQGENLPNLHQTIENWLRKHKENLAEQSGNNRPVVEPIHSIRHQITMYQGQIQE